VDMRSIWSGQKSRKGEEAPRVDKSRFESASGSLAPFGTSSSASQYERRCVTQNAGAASDASRGRRHGSKPRRRTSAQVRAHLAREVFRCVGIAVRTNSVLSSRNRKSGWNGRKGV
jgi:hypothetical protein